MKNLYLLFTFALMSIFAFGQTPQAFKYQAIARDLNGNPVINQEISVKISILSGSPEGTVEYCELHQTTTNNLGLINLEVGRGTAVTGNFTLIAWGNNACFIKTEMDLAGGENFVFMGTSQLLSVPYSLFSDNGIRSMTTEERDALVSPFTGMQIYNSTSNCLNYFNGTAWFETCGQCTPLPTQADAGEDQYFADATLTTTLQGNIPVNGIGTWTIESGIGGSFANTNDPQTLFTGQQCESYSLIWTITTPCGSTSDAVLVTFFTTPTTANAGDDQTNVQATWTTLAANTPLIGQGHWTIIQGTGGQLVSPFSPNSIFLGQTNSLYVLEWKISSVCTNSTDTVQIIFGCAPQPTIANAGSDQLIYDVTSTILQGNAPSYGTGEWSIISGSGGIINNPEYPNSNFTGQTNITYELQWTISNACGFSNDKVFICFWSCGMNINDTRDDKVYSTIQIGTQCWMSKNLNIGNRIAGTTEQTNNATIEKYCYDNSEINCDDYGGLYQWDEMMGYSTTPSIQGICPIGWHLPTDADWTELTTYLGGESVAGGKMKETGTTHWLSPNAGATNSSGFTGLPSGRRINDGSFIFIGDRGHWWSSTEYMASSALMHYMSYNFIWIYPYYYNKGIGFSVRCLRVN